MRSQLENLFPDPDELDHDPYAERVADSLIEYLELRAGESASTVNAAAESAETPLPPRVLNRIEQAKRVIDALEEIAGHASASGFGTSGSAQLTLPGAPPKSIGRFEIAEQIGAGGFGSSEPSRSGRREPETAQAGP